MRIRIIAWLEWLLARLGHDWSAQLIAARQEAMEARLQTESLQAQSSARRARQAILHEAINGLWADAVLLDLAKQGNEWKRRQLYSLAKKNYTKISDDLCALASCYVLYYVHQENVKGHATIVPTREDV
jgi:hypothetical protein